jgi:hypothetical protein
MRRRRAGILLPAGDSTDHCRPLVGDTIVKTVSLKSGKDLSTFMDKWVRLHFVMKGADLLLDPVCAVMRYTGRAAGATRRGTPR